MKILSGKINSYGPSTSHQKGTSVMYHLKYIEVDGKFFKNIWAPDVIYDIISHSLDNKADNTTLYISKHGFKKLLVGITNEDGKTFYVRPSLVLATVLAFWLIGASAFAVSYNFGIFEILYDYFIGSAPFSFVKMVLSDRQNWSIFAIVYSCFLGAAPFYLLKAQLSHWKAVNHLNRIGGVDLGTV